MIALGAIGILLTVFYGTTIIYELISWRHGCIKDSLMFSIGCVCLFLFFFL